ncbi:acetamidase/formamidase family protein [Lapillicoccus jejuensis]|uniref:Acetamidase/formamidase n=1 Tax=Lapillicoccus jejuensis TaxID=402171 RepID=A0A542DZJ1_9MICO|nr:acetamidase/formamidase family protein [Lapillicoccus jejuensis]TQJ08511.1 acetamidase/formamidase [Lapillicoccus jejuensis]
MTDHFLGKDLGSAGFDAAREPVLTVRPGAGDRITFETDDAAYAEMERYGDLAQVTATINPVTGPVLVEGAEPGDALAVTIHDIALAEQGWSVYLPGAGALTGRMGEAIRTRRIPVRDGVVHLTDTLTCPVAPMIGCLGVASASGTMSTVMPSYPTGGNMDLTDARPGATVLLPVEVPGALLSVGDLHAVMSRGESSFVAIEIAGRATLSVDLVKGAGLRTPRIDTGDEWVTVGLGDPVQDSVQVAYEAMFDLLTREQGLDDMDAYVVMSALAHTELGGPTGSAEPDPLHPFRPVGAVTLARLAKAAIAAR